MSFRPQPRAVHTAPASPAGPRSDVTDSLVNGFGSLNINNNERRQPSYSPRPAVSRRPATVIPEHDDIRAQTTQSRPISARAKLISEVLRPSLKQKSTSSYVDLSPYYADYRVRCMSTFRALQREVDLPEQCLANFFRLMEGDLRFPVLLLQNPTESHERTYESMIETTRTLSFLKQTLAEVQLSLDHVVILDVYPLLTTPALQPLSDAQRVKLVGLAFDLTLDFLYTFQPRVILSCQCHTRSSYPDSFSYPFSHPTARELGSMLDAAQSGAVAPLYDGDSDAPLGDIIMAFHPVSRARYDGAYPGREPQAALARILHEVYAPCGEAVAVQRLVGMADHDMLAMKAVMLTARQLLSGKYLEHGWVKKLAEEPGEDVRERVQEAVAALQAVELAAEAFVAASTTTRVALQQYLRDVNGASGPRSYI